MTYWTGHRKEGADKLKKTMSWIEVVCAAMQRECCAGGGFGQDQGEGE